MTDSDWKECLDWIVRLDFLDRDEPLSRVNVQIHDFAQFLRDGVILCRLLNALAPGVIDQREFSQRPQMSQFLCGKNIRVFLKKCYEEFKLASDDLFDIPELFDLKDFARVVRTLAILSNTPLALQSGNVGFQVESHQDYGTLKSVPELVDNNNNNTAYSKYDEKIYQDILSIKRQESMMESMKVSKMTKREYCLREIVDTEKNHIKVLQMVIEQFKKPLSLKLSKKNVDVLFNGIDDLHEIHNGFYSDLSKACQSRHGTVLVSGHMTIADCFIKWKERFLAYADYCSNLVAVNSLLGKLLDHASSRAAIMQCQSSANGGKFRLSDLLTIPMQRILRYHLLLKELIKNTDEGHPERRSLDRAYEEMQDLAAYVNEAKRDNENMTNIVAVQNSIINSTPLMDFKTYGHLQMDGELRYKVGEEKKDKIGFMFLFDKVLLICKSKSTDQYSLKESYELMDSNITIINNTNKDKFGFHLYMLKNNNMVGSSKNNSLGKTQDILVFYTKSEGLRTKWIDRFKTSIDNICPPGWTNHRHRFVLTTFHEPTICDVCRKLLRGVFFQGYKCKNTKMSVHKTCISQAKNIDGPPTVPPREASGHKARATCTYAGLPPPPSSQPPLPFNEGDLITILSTENDPWWMGKNGAIEGYFPKNFVSILKEDSQTPAPNQSTLPFLTPHPSTPIGPSFPTRQSRARSMVQFPVDSALSHSPLPNQHSFNSDAPPLPARVRLSNVNMTQSPTNLLQPCPLAPSQHSPPLNSFLNDFFGEDLAVFPWFVGEMTRDRAGELLSQLPDGSYLVRISNTGHRKGELSLSLKFGGGKHAVKNIKIQRNVEKRWFLAECKTFYSVQDTIEHYQQHSLESCFTEVPTTLTTPFKDTLPSPDNY